MKKILITLIACCSFGFANAQLNYCSNTIPSASVSVHMNVKEPAKSYLVVNTSKDLPQVLLIEGWKDILDRHLMVLKPLDTSDKTNIYCSFENTFSTITLYDDKMLKLFSLNNDSKLYTSFMKQWTKKEITLNDFFQ